MLVPSAEGSLERDGVSLLVRHPRVRRRCGAVEGLGGEASSEAEIAQRVRGGPRMGRTAELGRGLSEDWVSSGSGEDLGAVGELEPLHVIRV